MQTIRIAHLSDIHFRKGVSDEATDLDKDARSQLVADLAQIVEESGPLDLVTVTGDIAFAGQPDEYRIADEFIADVAQFCPEGTGAVKVVPGNHDVDRSRISLVGDLFRTSLRSCAPDEIDETLQSSLHDADVSTAMFRPLAAYNDFALGYGCAVSEASWWWQYELALDGGRLLRIVGLNTALVCNERDSAKTEATKVVVGLRQLQLPANDGAVVMVLGHHPPDWWRDPQPAKNHLQRAHLQLFGHLHEQALATVNNSVVLVAGAANPEREKGFFPRYNVIELAVSDADLRVTVYPRRWSDVTTGFVSDHDHGEYPVPFHVTLDPFKSGSPTAEQSVVADDSSAAPTQESLDHAAIVPPVDEARSMHDLVNKLSFGQQVAIFARLGLIDDTDKVLDGSEIRRSAITRARERGLLSELFEMVPQDNSDCETR